MKDIVFGEGEEQERPEGKFYLFLDQVTDPQNFGSILRSAFFIGVDGIIVNKMNACGLTPVVSKVSSGALEFIPLYTVKFVSHFFEDAKKDPLNFKIISTALSDMGDDIEKTHELGLKPTRDEEFSGSEDDIVEFGDLDSELKKPEPELDAKYKSLTPLDELTIPGGKKQNIILVLGSEGEGVSRAIAKAADHQVVIPPQLRMDQLGKFPFDTIDSLNVGVTAAMVLHHIRKMQV